VITTPHCGNPSKVRNIGIARARGEYVAFLDADDVWMPNKLEQQLDMMKRDGPCYWSYTLARRIDAQGRELPMPPERTQNACAGWIVDELITFDAVVTTPTVMVKRELLAEVGGFDESFVYCGDYELWIRLAQRRPVCVVPFPLAFVRTRSDSHTVRPRVAVYRTWARLYDRLMAECSEAKRGEVCRRQAARNAFFLAGALRAERRYREAWDVLLAARRYRPPPTEWLAALVKTVVRPLIPTLVVSFARRRGLVGSRSRLR
jgi:hypothetical protein